VHDAPRVTRLSEEGCNVVVWNGHPRHRSIAGLGRRVIGVSPLRDKAVGVERKEGPIKIARGEVEQVMRMLRRSVPDPGAATRWGTEEEGGNLPQGKVGVIQTRSRGLDPCPDGSTKPSAQGGAALRQRLRRGKVHPQNTRCSLEKREDSVWWGF